MGDGGYKIRNTEGVYFLSFATVGWVDVFTRSCYSDVVVNMLKSVVACQWLCFRLRTVGSIFFNKSKSILPSNHKELFEHSVADPKDVKTRWTKEGTGKKAVYHRFQNEQPDGKGAWHWNGSTSSKDQSGKDRSIAEENVPIEIKRN